MSCNDEALTHDSSSFDASFHEFAITSRDRWGGGDSGSTAAEAAMRAKELMENLSKNKSNQGTK